MSRPRLAALTSLALFAGLPLALAAEPEKGATAPATASAQAPAPADAPFGVDLIHSSIVFSIQAGHRNDVWGRFNVFSGTFLIHPDKPEASSIDITVEVKSIDTGVPARDEHLKKDDFFHTAKFPQATFKSTKFIKSGEQWQVQGDFTMLGVTKPITATLDYRGAGPSGAPGGGEASGIVATFTLKRSEFGMTKYLDNLADDVKMTVSLAGKR